MKLIVNFVLIAVLFISNQVVASESISELRALYKKWVESYQSLAFNDQKTLLNSLKNYPLYPYAEVQFLQNNLDTIPAKTVTDFIKENKNKPLTSQLSKSYLAKLTAQKNWHAITTFPRDNSIVSICQSQYALFMQGKKTLAFKPVKNLWLSSRELPSDCDPLLNAWEKAGKKTPNLVLQRISLAVQENNLKLAVSLAKQLPKNHKTTKDNLLASLSDPKQLGYFSDRLTANDFTKKVVLALFPRLARADADLAKKLLPKLVKRQKLTSLESQSLQLAIAGYYFKDSAIDKQIKWRDYIIAKYYNLDLLEKRIRLAISKNNYQDIAFWLKKLNAKDQLKDEWQYWQARTLLKKDSQNVNAKAILEKLSNNRGFYAMISAQALNKNYKLNNQSKSISESELASLKTKYDNLSVIKRITELRYWGMLSESSNEWRYYLYHFANQDKTQYAEFAKYAYEQGWGELSVQATILGKLWNNWTERLPIMYKSLYNKALKDKEISLSYALAITRQESGLDATVQSPVGASGLMQLMPSTAEFTAKNLGVLPNYSKDQLFDPETNIQLGTHYLNFVYLNNNNNRILSSAAYNAGPHRVKSWLEGSNGKLDAVAFIESIPFNETRNYVKSVLVYDYIYQTKLTNNATAFLNSDELNQQY